MDEINRLRTKRSYRYYDRDKDPRYIAMWERLVSVKGDTKKVKSNFAAHGEWMHSSWRGGDYCWYSYSFNVWGHDRYPQTTREIRLNAAHADEYGEQFVRGRRRNLPTCWDDLRSGRWDKRKSWKDSTKRRKQWVPK
jgi:hypothetical protein